MWARPAYRHDNWSLPAQAALHQYRTIDHETAHVFHKRRPVCVTGRRRLSRASRSIIHADCPCDETAEVEPPNAPSELQGHATCTEWVMFKILPDHRVGFVKFMFWRGLLSWRFFARTSHLTQVFGVFHLTCDSGSAQRDH